jgi:sucrose phosphorylase
MAAHIRTPPGEKAFHPGGAQRVLAADEALFTLLRSSPDGREHVLCVQNVAGQERSLRLDSLPDLEGAVVRDLLGGADVTTNGDRVEVQVGPYQVRWIKWIMA